MTGSAFYNPTPLRQFIRNGNDAEDPLWERFDLELFDDFGHPFNPAACVLLGTRTYRHFSGTSRPSTSRAVEMATLRSTLRQNERILGSDVPLDRTGEIPTV